jgi:hypothetical protein
MVSMFVAVVLLTPISPVMADRDERDVVVKFNEMGHQHRAGKSRHSHPTADPHGGRHRRTTDAGTFVGEMLDRKQWSGLTAKIVSLQAIYEVQAGAFSCTALIHGGSGTEEIGLLDGVILNGWRAGAPTMKRCAPITATAVRPLR